jgi:hypothetical protein
LLQQLKLLVTILNMRHAVLLAVLLELKHIATGHLMEIVYKEKEPGIELGAPQKPALILAALLLPAQLQELNLNILDAVQQAQHVPLEPGFMELGVNGLLAGKENKVELGHGVRLQHAQQLTQAVMLQQLIQPIRVTSLNIETVQCLRSSRSSHHTSHSSHSSHRSSHSSHRSSHSSHSSHRSSHSSHHTSHSSHSSHRSSHSSHHTSHSSHSSHRSSHSSHRSSHSLILASSDKLTGGNPQLICY